MKFSIFGRNSWVLKVLAHEKSDEIQKKSVIFMAWWRVVLIKLSQDERCFSGWALCKTLIVVGNFQVFGRNSWFLKVLALEKSDEIQKQLKS